MNRRQVFIIKGNKDRRYFVYMHVNKINGKRYVGITGRKKPEQRWGRNGKGYQNSQRFYNAIKKYGWDNFDHLILYENLTEEKAKEKEIELIAKYKANDAAHGYNITAGGDDCSHICLRGKDNHSYGKPVPLKIRKKLVKTSTEYYRTHEAPRTNQHLSDKSKRKIAETRAKNGCAYPVLCVETGKTYISLREASRDTGVNRSSIASCCKGKRESAKGYHFEYINKDNNNTRTNGQKRKVICLDTNKIYDSLTEAAKELGVDKNRIWSSCQSDIKTARGLNFNYYEDE